MTLRFSVLFVLLPMLSVSVPVASAQDSTADGGSSHRADNESHTLLSESERPNETTFESELELQLAWAEMPRLSVGIPLGSYLHLEIGMGGTLSEFVYEGQSQTHVVLMGDFRLRVDLTAPESVFCPFIRVAAGFSRATYTGLSSEVSHWAHGGLTAGFQVRLHRHFGVEFDAGVNYRRSAQGISSRAAVLGIASAALVAYL